MPSADFAAAQERLAARRRQREVEARARADVQRASHANQLSRLPFPFNRLGGAGLSVWDAIRGREGTQPAFRVGQVDAELLDEELLELLKGQVGEGLKLFGSHLQDEWSAEILLALRAILFKLTIWDHNASYGAALQGLRYSDARDKNLARPPPKPWQKAIYGAVTVGGRYAWSKWEDYLITRSEDYTAEPTPRLRFLSRLTSFLSTTHSVTALASFLIFLTNGRYRTLLDRILRLRLTPTTHATSREVSFEYLNRQLVWHAFTEFLLFLLPLVGIHRWRRILSRSWRKIKAFFFYTLLGRSKSGVDGEDDAVAKNGELAFLPERTCAICYADQNPTGGASEAEVLAASGAGGGGVVGSAATDITNPYEAIPCGCVYCFVCLAQRIDAEEGEGWTCLRCGELVKECKPWNGDVLEEVSKGAEKGKSVGFAAEAQGEDTETEKGEMRQVEPVPEEDEKAVEVTHMVESEAETGVLASRNLDESEAWARGSTEDDEQSEEYDEEEEDLDEGDMESMDM